MKLSEICLSFSFEIYFLPTLFFVFTSIHEIFGFGGEIMLWDATNVDHNILKVDNYQKMFSTTDLRNVCSLKIGKLGG